MYLHKLPDPYHTNATKHLTYNIPNRTRTNLNISGTKSFGVMRPKLKFLATSINVKFGEESTKPSMKIAPFLC